MWLLTFAGAAADDAQEDERNGILGLGHHVLQQPSFHPRPRRRVRAHGRLDITKPRSQLVRFLLLPFCMRCADDCVSRSPSDARNVLLFAIAFSGAAAVGISFTTAWCIRVTSSTTYRYAHILLVPSLISAPSLPPSHAQA